MFKEKRFALRPMDEILEDFTMAKQLGYRAKRIFLADGDALVRRAEDLAVILDHARACFPECERITAYASPSSLQVRTEEELQMLREKGLTMVYMGLESGSDTVLSMMHKGHDARAIIDAGIKARRCGMALSVTAISGLGGTELWQEHAVETARALNEMNPEYIGLLTLMVEPETPLYDWVQSGKFHLLDQLQVLDETELLVEHLDSPGSVFRSNHASNYLVLAGTLNGEKEQLLRDIRTAKQNTALLRPEYFRGL